MFITMSKRIASSVFCFIVLCATSLCFAQVNDAGLWASINLEKKVSSKLTLTFTEEARFNENISEPGTLFSEIGGNYKLKKYLVVGASYRFIQRRRVDDFYSMRHRYMMDVSLKHKIKKVAFTFRERFQTQYANINSSETGKVADRYLRSKLTVKFDLDKKYTPFISAELFYQLTNPKGNELDNMRYAAGFEYKFNKRTSVDLFYLINKEINMNDPVNDYVTGIGFNYSF